MLSQELKRKLDYRPGIYNMLRVYVQIIVVWEKNINIRASIITITACREPKSFRVGD